MFKFHRCNAGEKRKYFYLSRILWLLFLLNFPFMRVHGQVSGQSGFNVDQTYPSPDVASLGIFGLIPANPFNGQADVSIPIYNVKYKDISIPISMSYSTGGLKVDDHPGWVGLGWALKSGGAIYRKVNGAYDEHPKDFLDQSYSSEVCYYYNCGRVSDNFNNIDSIKKYAYDGASGIERAANAYDAAPDEFMFNFNGYSGTFYITRASANSPVELKVKSNGSYKLKAEILEIKNDIQFDDWIDTLVGSFRIRNTDRSIYAFKITDDKGFQYIFGNDDNAIEFSNMGAALDPYFLTIATAWHLTKIISPSGYEVDLKYKRAGRVFVQKKQRNARFYDASYNFGGSSLLLFTKTVGNRSFFGSLEYTYIIVLNPAYLDSIITPNQTIDFFTSKTNELDYPLDPHILDEITGNAPVGGNNISYWQKLDRIDIDGVMKVKFNYRNKLDKRLRLNSIEFDSTDLAKVSTYKFKYDSMSLPPYNSKMADHWGYYNGRSYAYDTNYLAIREPDADYLQAEMLDTIKYPTGGYLALKYEPHYYSKIAKQFPFEVHDTTSNIMAGGLRVKRISTAANSQVTPITKDFFYTTNYLSGGTRSSGILSGVPKYRNTGTLRTGFKVGNFWGSAWYNLLMYFGKILDNNFRLLSNTNGNHVTYTEVTEKTNNGYIVYRYTNHDNGYHDKPPYIMDTNFNSEWHEEGFTSMEAYRGLLLSKQYYDQNKRIIKKTTYDYLIDTSSTDYKVPYFYRIYDKAMGLSRVSTCVYFTKPPLIKTQREVDYGQSNEDSIVTVQNFKYFPDIYPNANPSSDNFQVSEIETTTSKIYQTLKTTYQYPSEYPSSTLMPLESFAVYRDMAAKNMISIPVETINSIIQGGVTKVTGSTLQLFSKDPATSIISPSELLTLGVTSSITNFEPSVISAYSEIVNSVMRFYERLVYDSRYLSKMKYDKYDNLGNLLQDHKSFSDLYHSYIWDYNGAYPIANVTNAKQADIAYTSFEADGMGNWSYSGTPSSTNGSVTGDKAYALSSGSLSKSGLTSSRKYTISYWLKSGGSVSVSGGSQSNNVTGATIHGWTYHEKTISGATTVNLSGSGYIDEVRLYPSDAQMVTYTYKPSIGMTSQCDAESYITYYSYDGIGRLNEVRDEDGHILKQYTYDYTDKQDLPLYYNTYAVKGLRRECSGGDIGSIVTYVVPAGTYSSDISQQDAQNQALADIDANAQDYANAHGSCTVPDMIDVNYVNSSSVIVNIFLTNVATQQTYSFSLPTTGSSSQVVGQIPEGFYNVTFSPTGSATALYTYNINVYYESGVHSATINNVELLYSGSAHVNISNY